MTGAALCGGLAGCESLGRSDSKGALITEVAVTNLDTDPHLFAVLVRDRTADEVVFWERYAADAAVDRDGGGRVERTDGTVWSEPVPGPGEYVLYAAAEREVIGNDSRWEVIDAADRGSRVAFDVEVDRDGFLDVEIRFPKE